MDSLRSYSPLVAGFATLVMAFILIPVLFIALYSFNDAGYLTLPPHGATLKWFVNFFAIARFRSALESSLVIAAIVAPACLLIALPTALALVRYDFPGRGFANAAIMSPLVVPGVVTGISFLTLSARL